jgi:hypothetical protein
MTDSLSLRWRAFRQAKRGHTDDECEDAWAADPATLRFAVADGASESAFASLWARMLVEGYVKRSGSLEAQDWLINAQQCWLKEVMPLDLEWYAEMKRQEGAFATFLGLTIILPAPDRPGNWFAEAMGDSCLVRVRVNLKVRAFPMQASADFANVPQLIGSRDSPKTLMVREFGSLVSGDRIYLMTDALAQWFLKSYESGNKPWDPVSDQLTSTEGTFPSWIEKLRSQDGLRNDDVTLIAIEV